MAKSKKIQKSVVENYKKEVKQYERSDNNKIRSVAVYYTVGVMGKRKYRKVYRESSFTVNSAGGRQNVPLCIAGCPFPKLLSYDKLMCFIKQIDIGTIYSVSETLCEGLSSNDKVHGCYRNLEETLLTLGQYYLSNQSLYDFKWFSEPNTFYISIGGDGAPFGKDDTACSWLVGILNITRGVLSSNENFLIFGANCHEDSVPVKRYIQKLLGEIQVIEKKNYKLKDQNGVTIDVKFRVGELPNDMKMLAFICGELSNSATYFSSFADVTGENGTKLDGTFGKDKKHTWHPWDYQNRIEVAKEVQKEKVKLSKKKVKMQTMRSNITKFISSKKSRQEFEPLLGSIVDRIHVDPLHLKNNLCALLHRHLLELVVYMSNLSNASSFQQLPSNSPFVCYVKTLQSKCHLTRLASKIIRWFNDLRHKEKKFDYRFTGKDSRGFVNNFMYLISCVENISHFSRVCKQMLDLHIIGFLCLTLRDCISLFSRVEITHEEVNKLEELTRIYFRVYTIFFSFHPSVWTLGLIVPAHTKEMKVKYNLGLGLNSMEGRESKHVSISRYSENTHFNNRWEQIFRHEYISLLWLRHRGINKSTPVISSGLKYIPTRVSQPGFCYCGFDKDPNDNKCYYCSHQIRTDILECNKQGKLLDKLKAFK